MPGLVGGFGSYLKNFKNFFLQIFMFIKPRAILTFHKERVTYGREALFNSKNRRARRVKPNMSNYQPSLIYNHFRKGFYLGIGIGLGLGLGLGGAPYLSNKKQYYSNGRSLSSKNFTLSHSLLGSYLAGLIEGDGTIAVHDPKSTTTKYSPKIIIVFKKADLPLANYLQHLTNSGSILIKPERGYILWQIQDIVSIFTIISIINRFMRTPKIEVVHRTIDWLNNYIVKNKNSNLPSTIQILSIINKLEKFPLDESPIESNSWFSGFTDADGNFSINIHKRKNRNSTRVQLFYRLEINKNYHKLDSEGSKVSFFPIMSKIGLFLGVTVFSRSRLTKDKIFYSFTVISHNKDSNLKVCEYFNKFPLLSSKYLDYKDWSDVLNLQNSNKITTSYLDKAIKIRTDFNSTRKTYMWNHLNNNSLRGNI